KGTGLVPSAIWPFLNSSLLGWNAKIRMGLEPFVPALLGEKDESIAGFIRRRLGSEMLDKIAGPMLGGIYAGDCENLALKSFFPQLKEMELRGGVMKSMRGRRGAPAEGKTLFMTLKG